MSNNKKQQKTKTFKLSEFEPKPRSYDIINSMLNFCPKYFITIKADEVPRVQV